jgi:rubrerythrin
MSANELSEPNFTVGRTIMNLFDFAMKMELNGKELYEKLAGQTDHVGLKAIFTSLAADEQKHYDIVNALKSGAESSMAETTVLDKAQSVFRGLMEDKILLGSMRKSLDGYYFAMKIEADSVRLYEDMARKETRAETAMLLQKIADEEKKHYNIMENLYDLLLAPQTYLAWGEFSNLKEF